ncbi:hypothetical protein CK217_03365 [Mesorhizobium loti]|nr:hypothetical protein BAE42_01805 [Mesorhizobium loti]QGX77332.1 hypothetical protein EB234_10745 [Mesorhizobium japonicum R7A]OBP91748.1 hypothetical protein BAE41_01325 [Mesorhizobium loti]OBP95750.1 hypothetical protein BAE40_10920 [Mesorhizobium loti]PBB57710.1 hypothetical protein CK223_02625 [Mesorhizobium loti]
MVLVERMFMAKSIAAKNRMRNRFEKSVRWPPLRGLMAHRQGRRSRLGWTSNKTKTGNTHD